MLSPEQVLLAPERLPRHWAFDWSTLAQDERDGLWAEIPNMAFATSGTSGLPIGWTRTRRQLRDEVEVTLRCLPTDFDRVVTTVMPTSLYGYVCGVLLAMRLGVPVIAAPTLLCDITFEPGRTLAVTVAPSWRTGRAVPTAAFGARITFLHSGSVLAPRPVRLIGDMANAEIVDLFGATEVGLIGSRRHGDAAAANTWDLVEDVEMTVIPIDEAGGGQLVIRSARIATREGDMAPVDRLVLGDVGALLDARRFRFDGRVRKGKPNGRPVDLVAIETLLWDLAPEGTDLACGLAIVDHGEIVVVRVAGQDADVQTLRDRMHEAASRLPLVPRLVRVPYIERSAMGKPRYSISAHSSQGGDT